MNRLLRASACAMILLGLTATRARAELTITASPIGLQPGGIGTINLSITSNSGDTLSQFGLELVITPLPGTTSQLQFTTTQSDPYGNPNYVFSGESIGADLPSPFWSLPLTHTYASDSIIGGDMDDGTGPTSGYVTIPGTAGEAHTYLATVQFQVPTTAALGDQFQISLLPGPNTYFDDQNGNPLTPMSNTVGTVAVVPEPSAFMLMAISNLGSLLYLRFRRKGKSRRSASAS
jgi:hypothetical protein